MSYSYPGALATAVAKGKTMITAAMGAISNSTTLTVNAVALQSITVTPATATIGTGATQQFQAIGHYSDGSAKGISTTVT